MSKKKSKERPLTRWVYFTKTLYRNAADEGLFEYDKVLYNKSEELMDIEEINGKINMVLVFLLFVLFALGTRVQNGWLLIGYFILVIVGQISRLLRLPKDIKAHLTDSGRRKR